MKKEIKTQYGIQITKPWSTAMYDHNEQVAEVVKEQVSDMWRNALSQLEESLDTEDEEGYEIAMLDLDWNVSFTDPLLEIQRAVTVYSFGYGYSIAMVSERVERELENAPLYRLKEIAEDLGLELEKEFIGFN
jgi:cyclopropane fatty-acyl-phospholipid synthase-like methyltransferase